MLPIFHLLIPIAILRLFRVNKKVVFFLSPITLLPDVDHIGIFLGLNWTRALFHNIFFGILLILVLIVFKQLLKNYSSVIKSKSIIAKGIKYFSKYDTKKTIFIASFMYVSHLLLDYEGVALLWPFSKVFYGFSLKTMSFSYLTADVINKGLLKMPIDAIMFYVAIALVAFVVLFLEIYIVYRVRVQSNSQRD